MNPQGGQPQGIDINAIRQALARRAGIPSMGQAPTTPVLGQMGTPTATTPTGGAPQQTAGSPQIATPATPQPQFSSPFAGPGAGQGFDEQTRKIGKALISRLLQIL